MADDNNVQRVLVVDIRMSFWSMVVFMVKAAIAAIPALIILGLLGAILAAALGGLGAGMHSHTV